MGSILSRHRIKKISGFSFKNFHSGETFRISCGFKNVRIRVSQITCHQLYKMPFNTCPPNKFFVSFLFGMAHIAFCIVLHFIEKLRFACEYAPADIFKIRQVGYEARIIPRTSLYSIVESNPDVGFY